MSSHTTRAWGADGIDLAPFSDLQAFVPTLVASVSTVSMHRDGDPGSIHLKRGRNP